MNVVARVLISLPDEFLAEVDALAQSEHRSRSELIREALRLYMAGSQHPRPSRAAGSPSSEALAALEQIQRMRRDLQVTEHPQAEAWLRSRRERHG